MQLRLIATFIYLKKVLNIGRFETSIRFPMRNTKPSHILSVIVAILLFGIIGPFERNYVWI